MERLPSRSSSRLAATRAKRYEGLGNGSSNFAQPVAGRDQIAVGQQHRVLLGVGAHGGRVARHHVGPVDEPGDAPEALGLALGDEAVLGGVQAFELGVLLRHDPRHGLEREGIGHLGDRELVFGHLVRNRLSVQRHGNQLELVSVQHQRAGRVAADLELRAHQRVVFADVDVEVDRVDPKRRRGVILEVDCAGLGLFHPPILGRGGARDAAI